MSTSTDETRDAPFSHWLAKTLRRHPFAAIALGLGLVAAVGSGIPKVRADFTHRAFFWDDDPFLIAFDQFERRFGNDDALVIAVHSPSGVFDLETASVLKELTEKMWLVPEVIRVDSLSNYNWVHAVEDEIIVEPFFPEELSAEVLEARQKTALADEVLPGYLVSKDAKTAMVFARIKPGIDQPPDSPAIVSAARKVVAEATRGDHEMYISGGPAINFAFQESSQFDLSRLVPALLVLSALFIGLTLRTVGGVVLPFIVAFLSIIVGFGVAGRAGFTFGTVTTVFPNLMIAVAIADSVHIISGFYIAMAQGMDRKDAAQYSLAKNVLPTFLTSITTAFGFLSFVTADLKPLSSLGVMAGAGTMAAWGVTYLVVGSLLFVLPLHRKPRAEREATLTARVVDRAVRFMDDQRWKIVVSTAVIAAVSVVLALRLEVNSDPMKYFAKDFPARIANEFIEKTTGGARIVELVVDSGAEDGIKDPVLLGKVDALQEWLEQQPRVTRTISIVDILKATHRSLNGNDQAHYRLADSAEAIGQELLLYTMGLPQGMDLNDRVTIKNDALRVTVLWTIPTSAETMEMVDEIEAKGRELGIAATVTGKTRLYNSTNGYVVSSFVTSMLIALALITITLMLAFRSVSLGLISLIPNVVPILVGGAVLKLIGQPLDIGTALVASVALGIAVDDTIHMLANYRRHRAAGLTPHEAVQRTLEVTGVALVSTTLVLVVGFGVFAFGTFMPNVFFGILTATVLFVALIVDLVFLPALLFVLHGVAATAPSAKPEEA